MEHKDNITDPCARIRKRTLPPAPGRGTKKGGRRMQPKFFGPHISTAEIRSTAARKREKWEKASTRLTTEDG